MKCREILLILILVLTSCFISFSLFAQIPTSGLVGYWPLNGNYNDAGPYAIHGTNTASTATTNKAGTANSAMNFLNPGGSQPVNQYGRLPINTNLNFSAGQNFTISLLALFNAAPPHAGGVFDNNLNTGGPGVWFWEANGYPQIQFNFGNSSLGTTNGALSYGTWQHISCVKQGTAISVYINGVLNATRTHGSLTPTYPLGPGIGTMTFASYTPPVYNGLNGKLDEIRVYNRALSAAEILLMNSTILPLKLGDFTAVKKSTGIELNWGTITEQNTSHFEIERSADGNNFSRIGTVAAAGNSTDKKYYTFNDNNPLSGTNFYRLKMVDIDNSSTYSRIIIVKNDAGLFTIQLFPNPVRDVLQVQLSVSKKESVKFSIADAAGRIVYDRKTDLQEGNNTISIPVTGYKAGMYYLIADQQEKRQTKNFIIK